MELYGLYRVARVSMQGNVFLIEVEDKEIVELENTIYAFVINDEYIRIGSSKGVLKKRLRSWERDVTRRLEGRETSTPDWEAKEWKERLEKHGEGIIYARRGTEVTTPVGTFPAYLDEESVLIGRHLPPLNRSKHR